MKTTTDNKDTTPVWYASYGSNMDPGRFACYIQGGSPAGSAHTNQGCDDKRPPRKVANVDLPYQLYFAGESPVWNGGVAFLGEPTTEHQTKGKAYLISIAQFEQVVAQESRRDHIAPIDLPSLVAEGCVDLGNNRYDRILYCGEYQGYPLLTFTSPYEQYPYTKPPHPYLKVIISGLYMSYGLTAEEIVTYLATKPGITHHYFTAELMMLVHSVLPNASASQIQSEQSDEDRGVTPDQPTLLN